MTNLDFYLMRGLTCLHSSSAHFRPCVRPHCLNLNISKTGSPIAMKFFLKQLWVVGKAALAFGADQIRTLVSMATDSFRSIIMRVGEWGRRLFLIRSFSYYTF